MKEKKQLFPKSLLKATLKERVGFFNEFIAEHKKLEDAAEELIRYLLYPSIDCHVILVLGPGGAGKTTLLRHLMDKVIERLIADKYCPDPGQIVQAFFTHPARKHFDWNEFYELGLKALNEPMLAHKIGYERELTTDLNGNLVIKLSVKKKDYRTIFMAAVDQRKPLWIGIDESDHFLLRPPSTTYQTQLQLIKSTATDAHTTLVLFGTYELLVLLGENEQIDRRIRVVHLERYRIDNPDTKIKEIADFRKILNTFALALVLPFIPDLDPKATWFYNHSLGNVGILKNWLMEALTLAIERGKEVQDTASFLQCCEETRTPRGKLSETLEKIQLGEARMEQYLDSISEQDLEGQLGSKYIPPKENDTKKNQTPFKRGPSRDEAGKGYK
jgi:hypothetical protein